MGPKSPSAVFVRLAAVPDFDAVAEIWHASASLPGAGPPQMPTLEDLRSRVDAEIAAGWRLFVAEHRNQLIGFLALKSESRTLDQLFVKPAHIGMGVGRLLMEKAKSEMPEGFKLHTASTNEHARKFYKRAGMTLHDEGRHPRTGHPIVWYGWSGRNSH